MATGRSATPAGPQAASIVVISCAFAAVPPLQRSLRRRAARKRRRPLRSCEVGGPCNPFQPQEPPIRDVRQVRSGAKSDHLSLVKAPRPRPRWPAVSPRKSVAPPAPRFFEVSRRNRSPICSRRLPLRPDNPLSAVVDGGVAALAPTDAGGGPVAASWGVAHRHTGREGSVGGGRRWDSGSVLQRPSKGVPLFGQTRRCWPSAAVLTALVFLGQPPQAPPGPRSWAGACSCFARTCRWGRPSGPPSLRRYKQSGRACLCSGTTASLYARHFPVPYPSPPSIPGDAGVPRSRAHTCLAFPSTLPFPPFPLLPPSPSRVPPFFDLTSLPHGRGDDALAGTGHCAGCGHGGRSCDPLRAADGVHGVVARLRPVCVGRASVEAAAPATTQRVPLGE